MSRWPSVWTVVALAVDLARHLGVELDQRHAGTFRPTPHLKALARSAPSGSPVNSQPFIAWTSNEQLIGLDSTRSTPRR